MMVANPCRRADSACLESGKIRDFGSSSWENAGAIILVGLYKTIPYVLA